MNMASTEIVRDDYGPMAHVVTNEPAAPDPLLVVTGGEAPGDRWCPEPNCDLARDHDGSHVSAEGVVTK
jgi:hypothetical protein